MSELKKFIVKLYLYKFFDRFMLIYPLYAVMFQETGMSAWQIATLFMVWKITSFVLEFPSGVTADKYSRKWQLIIAEVMILLAYLTWMISPNFLGYAIGFVLWGAKAAFTSGTLEAYVYDELKSLGHEDKFTRVYGRLSSVGLLAMSIAALLSVAVFNYGGYVLILAICVISNGIATLALASMKEAPIARTAGEQGYFAIAKKGISYVIKSKELFIIVMFTTLMASISIPIDEYSSLTAVEAGLAVQYLGLFSAALALMDMAGGFLADRFEEAGDALHYSLVVLSSLMLLTAALVMNELTILLFVLEAGLNPIVSVIFEGKMQKLSDSSVRATISSVRGFLARIGSILLILLMGLITTAFSYKEGYIFLAVLNALLGIGFLIYAYKRKKIVSENIVL